MQKREEIPHGKNAYEHYIVAQEDSRMREYLNRCPRVLAPVLNRRSERQVLVRFYQSMGGDRWTNKGGWNTNTPITDWAGIKVNRHKRVTDISLPKNNLKGEALCISHAV